MISNLLFINQKGEVVISRTYREGASQKVIDLFRHQVRLLPADQDTLESGAARRLMGLQRRAACGLTSRFCLAGHRGQGGEPITCENH